MKKVIVSAFSLFLLGAVSAQAQTTPNATTTTSAQPATTGTTATEAQTGTGTQTGTTATGTATQTDAASAGTAATGATGTSAAGTATSTDAAAAGTTVALEELPEAVKATLASEKLKTWTPAGAQLMKDATGNEYYSIQLKQANQIGTVKLSKEGKPVK